LQPFVRADRGAQRHHGGGSGLFQGAAERGDGIRYHAVLDILKHQRVIYSRRDGWPYT